MLTISHTRSLSLAIAFTLSMAAPALADDHGKGKMPGDHGRSHAEEMKHKHDDWKAEKATAKEAKKKNKEALKDKADDAEDDMKERHEEMKEKHKEKYKK
ncbi:MAG: hypothetical protein CMF31_01885 [Kordiimonas sp.]|nr:hypothetical protein [Kordiimonas sp.]